MNRVQAILGVMRAPFLLLPPACVAVGAGTAYWQNGSVNWWHALLVLVGALAAHISVNAFNEYFDFRSGLDANTQRTPFSGGSGTLPGHPEYEKMALGISLISLGVTTAVGAYFTWVSGWELLPLGIAGLVLVVTYTTWFVRNPILCLLAPGIGFGVMMVMGTHFALSGTYSWTAFIASLLPTALVSNLLLLNQFPDVEADREIKRRHFPILVGRKASSVIYGVLLLIGYGSVIVGIILGLLPVWSGLVLLTVIVAWQAYRGAHRNADNIPALIPSMGMNVILNLVTPILLAIGLFVGR